MPTGTILSSAILECWEHWKKRCIAWHETARTPTDSFVYSRCRVVSWCTLCHKQIQAYCNNDARYCVYIPRFFFHFEYRFSCHFFSFFFPFFSLFLSIDCNRCSDKSNFVKQKFNPDDGCKLLRATRVCRVYRESQVKRSWRLVELLH